MIRPETSPRAGRYADRDFELADGLDERVGFSVIADERRRQLLKLVDLLAEADRVVEEVRAAMLGPYGGLFRLVVLNRRSARAVARVTTHNNELNRAFDEVSRFPAGGRAAEILRDRLRLHLEAEAELVAGLSPERRAVVEGLRADRPA